MKTQISTTISPHTKKQINALGQKLGYSQRDILTVAIDRFYQSEVNETDELTQSLNDLQHARTLIVKDVNIGQWDSHKAADMLLRVGASSMSPEEVGKLVSKIHRLTHRYMDLAISHFENLRFDSNEANRLGRYAAYNALSVEEALDNDRS